MSKNINKLKNMMKKKMKNENVKLFMFVNLNINSIIFKIKKSLIMKSNILYLIYINLKNH